jgi:hypothetical protein
MTDDSAVRSLLDGDSDAHVAGRGAPADEPSRWHPLLSWRDHPALLEHQRLLRDVDHAAALALASLQRTLAERGGRAGKQESELLTSLVHRMEGVQTTAAEAGDDLYRFRKGEV